MVLVFHLDKLLSMVAGTHLGKLRAPLAPMLVPLIKTRKGTLCLTVSKYFGTTLFAKSIASYENLSANALSVSTPFTPYWFKSDDWVTLQDTLSTI